MSNFKLWRNRWLLKGGKGVQTVSVSRYYKTRHLPLPLILLCLSLVSSDIKYCIWWQQLLHLQSSVVTGKTPRSAFVHQLGIQNKINATLKIDKSPWCHGGSCVSNKSIIWTDTKTTTITSSCFCIYHMSPGKKTQFPFYGSVCTTIVFSTSHHCVLHAYTGAGFINEPGDTSCLTLTSLCTHAYSLS